MFHQDIMNIALRLLLNLSFDTDLQKQMVDVGLIPRLVDLLPHDLHRIVCLKLLYHLSMDDKAKSVFSFTDCIPMLMKLILETPADQFVAKEVIALAINLAANATNAEQMASGDGLRMLMARVKKTADSLLMKMIRNISSHDNTKEQFMVQVIFLQICAENLRRDTSRTS